MLQARVKKMKIKKNDEVVVIAGKDRGKTGKVERVIPQKNKVIVGGVNIVKKHNRPSKRNPQGGIMEMAAPIDVSNVMLKCSRCHKPTRIGYKILNQKKYRICKKCGEEI